MDTDGQSDEAQLGGRRPPKTYPELDLETGMYASMESMSIWELAHRWVGADPMTPDGSPIPITVQPVLRAVSRALASREIAGSHVVVCHIEEFDLGVAEYVADFGSYPDHPVSSEDILGILSCSPNRSLLDSIFVSLESVFHWVTRKPVALPTPDFLVPIWAWKPKSADKAAEEDSQPNKTEPSKRRPMEELLDKAMCQGAAIALWDVHPNFRISNVCAHPAYLKAGASKYSEKTRRNWAIEVAPSHIKGRDGRTPNEKPDNVINLPPVTET